MQEGLHLLALRMEEGSHEPLEPENDKQILSYILQKEAQPVILACSLQIRLSDS